MADQVKYTSKLNGSRILIIGGSSGIGFAAAECLLEHGASIIISSSNLEKVSNKVKRLQTAYPSKASQISGITSNLSDQASLEANIKKLLDEATSNGQHKLDHIVHTAGDPPYITPIRDITLDGLIQAGMVRFFSLYMLFKHVSEYMNAGSASSVVITSGSAGQRPVKGFGPLIGYATGMEGICRGMALDLAPLRVNMVSPGAVETELWDFLERTEEVKEARQKYASSTPTGQVAAPADVAEAYLYAIKDHNLTGANINTSGGQLLIGS